MKKIILSFAIYISALCVAQAQEGALGYNNCTGVAVSNCIVKTQPGQLFSLNVTASSGVTYVILLDQTTAAANGVAVPMKTFQLGTNPYTLSLSYIPMSLLFNNGLVVACSSGTAPTITLVASCLISGETR